MLNDNAGSGLVDINSKTNPDYASCLSQANQLLAAAPESHMCAKYIAGQDASKPSSNKVGQPNQTGYSLAFVSCSEQPEDLNGGS
jgi:hypothetical protein